MQHKTGTENGKVICELCEWTWTREPVSECPGVKRYDWANWTQNLMTKTQLRLLGLKPGAAARGAYYRMSEAGKANPFYWLYDINEAVRIRKRSKK